MNRQHAERLFCALLLAAFVPLRAPSQGRPGVIELKSANELKGRVINDADVRELIGNVHFIQYLREGGQAKVWSDRALQFLAEDRLELYDRVRVVRDSLTITGDQGVYYGKDRRVEIHGTVRLLRAGSVLTSAAGEYFPDEKRAVFTGSVRVEDSASVLMSDKLLYWEDEARSVAVGRVSVLQKSDGTTVFGDSLLNDETNHRSIVPSGARMIQVDTASDGTPDTLLVVSRMMESRQVPSRVLLAVDSVRMSRVDMSARSGGAVFAVDDDRITLSGDPIIWQENNQITGDTIQIRLKDRQLSSVFVRGHAMAVSRSDSSRPERFDQLTGRRLTMSFINRKVRQIDVEGTATSLYYLMDGTTPNGANKSSGDRIIMDFEGGQIDRIKVVRGVQGEYYPERMIRSHEADYNLDGFRWFKYRPQRVGLVMYERLVE